jgi:hypothetical protein
VRMLVVNLMRTVTFRRIFRETRIPFPVDIGDHLQCVTICL